MFDGCGLPPSQGKLRPATLHDLADVARLHVDAIDEGFLSTLGDRFLRRLYRRIHESRDAFLIVAVADNGQSVLGFVAGATSVKRLYRQFVVRDGLASVVTDAPNLLRSGSRAIETLRYGTGSSGGGRQAGEAELLSMAVSRDARRRGIGAALVAAFAIAAARIGSSSARVVVGAANLPAVSLYESSGFRGAQSLELHAGARSLVLRMPLPPVLRP